MSTHMALDGLPEEKVAAVAVRLINLGWFRVGGDRYASYVSPAVVEQYLGGRTIADFRPRHLRVIEARDVGLDPEESATLRLLRSGRIRAARVAA